MKISTLLIPIALAMPLHAGVSEVVSQQQTYAEPNPWEWFVGGSVSYLFEYEEPMYALNAGVKTPWSPLGFRTSFFAEVGWVEDDNESEIPLGVSGIDSDLEFVPATLNVQFEKELTRDLALYFGGGVGAAFTDLKVQNVGHDHDTVFAAQVFAGVNYTIAERHEIYTGARWIHIDDTENYDMDQTWAAELGYRFRF